MEYFHGSMIKGLAELQPFASPNSNLHSPLVYLTTSRQLALHYIWDTDRFPIKMPMLQIRSDGTLVFQEMFPHALACFYKGVSGYVYRCVGEYKLNASVGVPFCATSEQPVPVVDCEWIDDVYSHILRYEKTGTFLYEHYEDLPLWRKDVIRGQVLRMIKRGNFLDAPSSSASCFMRERFSAYWNEAQVLQEHGLL